MNQRADCVSSNCNPAESEKADLVTNPSHLQESNSSGMHANYLLHTLETCCTILSMLMGVVKENWGCRGLRQHV